MLPEVLAPQQPLLLRRDAREDHRVRRLHSRLRPRPRHLQQHPAARSIIRRAVVDVVPRHPRHKAEMVVVRRIHHRLVLARLHPWQNPHHIRRLERPHRTLDMRVQPHRKLDRLEPALTRRLDHEIRNVAEITRLALSASLHSIDNSLNLALRNALIHSQKRCDSGTQQTGR